MVTRILKKSLFLEFGAVIFILIFCSFKPHRGQAEINFKAGIGKYFNCQNASPDNEIVQSTLSLIYEADESCVTMKVDTKSIRIIKVALVQFDAIPEQPKRNLGEMERLMRQASSLGARIVMFHELTLSDYTSRLDDFAESVPDGPACERMGNLAKELNCFVSFGLSEKERLENDDRFYITQVFFGPTGFVYRYRKTWLWWDYEESDKWYRKEPARYDPGDGPELFMIDGIAATCFICRDGSSLRCLERAKNLHPQIVFYPSNYRGGNPAAVGGIAKKIGAPMLIANRIGASWYGENKNCLGNTAAFDAQGNVISQANIEGREEILIVEVPVQSRVF